MIRNYFHNCLVLIASAMLFISSCTAIIEPNIMDKGVILLAPANDITTFYSSQTFWWEEVVNANEYQLQIVTPDFKNIERLLLDTVINSNKFSYSLYPSQFQWRVKALNYSYSTDFTTWAFTIDSTIDLTNQAIVLTSPVDKDTTNLTNFIFSWERLYNAQSYYFQLDRNGDKIDGDTTSENQLSKNILINGSYLWKVKATNEVSETMIFSRSFYLYTKTPVAPIIEQPDDNAMFGQSDLIDFSWERDQESVPSIVDNLLVATDSLFSQIVINKECTNPNFQNQFDQDVYYWKVNSTDKAGNTSEYSLPRKFVVYNIKK